MLRFGLCCICRNEPIRFRQTTAKAKELTVHNIMISLDVKKNH
jgi:hypothetical protein